MPVNMRTRQRHEQHVPAQDSMPRLGQPCLRTHLDAVVDVVGARQLAHVLLQAVQEVHADAAVVPQQEQQQVPHALCASGYAISVMPQMEALTSSINVAAGMLGRQIASCFTQAARGGGLCSSRNVASPRP